MQHAWSPELGILHTMKDLFRTTTVQSILLHTPFLFASLPIITEKSTKIGLIFLWPQKPNQRQHHSSRGGISGSAYGHRSPTRDRTTPLVATGAPPETGLLLSWPQEPYQRQNYSSRDHRSPTRDRTTPLMATEALAETGLLLLWPQEPHQRQNYSTRGHRSPRRDRTTPLVATGAPPETELLLLWPQKPHQRQCFCTYAKILCVYPTRDMTTLLRHHATSILPGP